MIPNVITALEKMRRNLSERQNSIVLKRLFGRKEREIIRQAIKDAERATLGEIMVRMIRRFDYGISDVLTQARKEFVQLKMHETRDRTGVLVLLVWKERKFQIFGDEGITARLPQEFWDSLALKLASHFKEGKYVEPICEVVRKIGVALSKHFPRRSDDSNELPDDLSLEEE